MGGTAKYGFSSLSFIDLNGNSGPSINEVEFNGWLFRHCGKVLLLTPHATRRINVGGDGCVRAIGEMSIKKFPQFLYRQVRASFLLVNMLDVGALLYYRHSRLSFVVVLMKLFRPDVRVVVHRAHPAGSDDLISKSRIRRLAGRVIEFIDAGLRAAVYRRAEWIDCVNIHQAKALAAETGRDVQVVMNGVNVRQFSSVSEQERHSIRDEFGVPQNSVVIGYCGGFPMLRGARQIRALIDADPERWGVVIGRLSVDEVDELRHPRISLLGEIPYEKVPRLVAMFDIVVAFDIPERVVLVGNSNQKVRQGLASGAWILTANADIEIEGSPWLGMNVGCMDFRAQHEAVKDAGLYLQQRQRRIEFAEANLNVDMIFLKRHTAIMSGCHDHV